VNILITGANRGLGFELTKLAAEEGHTVYAGAYNKVSMDELVRLKQAHPNQVEVIDLDVAMMSQ